ncbi:MAG: hypothetical protein H0W62_03050 [Chitinophagales bacterium]|nr:hypothetical protein [Chitinophagales bacterium]
MQKTNIETINIYGLKLFSLLFIGMLLAGCQPKAIITTIDNPMDGFSEDVDSVRGANTVQDLACYLFLALQQKISYGNLTRFIPDSSDIGKIYQLTNSPVGNANLKTNADSVRHQLQKDLLNTESESSSLHATWTDATFTKLLIQEIEDQKLPSKKIMMQCKSNGITLLASCKCLKIGDKWYIGEDLKFGV